MASAPLLEVVQSASSGDIAVIVAQTPAIVLVDRDQRVSLYAHIEREIAEFEPDVSSKKGRDAIKALAFKITKTKTAIDAAGKQLNEEARAKIGVVDEARRDARNTLEILAEKVRAPLTAWEEAEKARIERAEKIIGDLREMGKVSVEDTAAAVRERGSAVYNTALDPEQFGDLLADAEMFKAASVEALKTALARLIREEADRAELDRLRAEAAEREAREEAERAAAAHAAEQAAAEQREKDRVAREAQEAADRIAAAERAAEQRVRDEEAKRAADAQAERDAAHAAEIAAERAKVVEAERLRQAEADRIAEVERRRAAQEASDRAAAQQLADEQAEREKNKAHRTRVKTAAKQAIMTCGVSEDAAQKVVLAIIAGEIPNVAMWF